MDTEPPTPRQERFPPRGKSRGGLKRGRGKDGFPAAPRAASASLTGDLPSAGCRTHIVNGAGGRVDGWRASPAAAPGQVTPLRWRLRRLLPGSGLFSFPSSDGGGGLDLGPQNAPRGESDSSGRREEESVGKGARGRRTNVRACERGVVRPGGGW